MLRSTITGKGARRAQARLRQRAQEVNRELTRAMHESVLIVEGKIVPRIDVDRGRMRGGVQTEVRGSGRELRGRVFIANVPHALVVERGRKPGSFPPIAPLVGWVQRRGMATGTDARRIAFLVARKIARIGIKAKWPFRDGTREARPFVRLRFRLAFQRLTR